MSRYWLGIVQREHVERGVKGGFAQVCHGKRGPLARMQPGDWLIYYSPKTALEDGLPLKAFTAIGQVQTGEPYSFQMSQDFAPYRRDVSFVAAQQAPIEPLLPYLSFSAGKPNWGYALRFGILELTPGDFRRIARAMQVDPKVYADVQTPVAV